jgi:hypothetical protein
MEKSSSLPYFEANPLLNTIFWICYARNTASSGQLRREYSLFFLAIFMVYRLNNIDGTVSGVNNIGLITLGVVITDVIIWGKDVEGVTTHATAELGWSTAYDQVAPEFGLEPVTGVCGNILSWNEMGRNVPALTTLALNILQPAEADSYLFDIIIIAEGL